MSARWEISEDRQSWQLKREVAAPTPTGAPKIDLAALASELRAGIRGEVRFDDGSKALYATDASNYRQTPLGIVIPRDGDDVVAAMSICRRHQAPVLGRGGGTSLAGQCCNAAVIFDYSKYMNKVVSIDVERKLARVMPGTILDALRAKTEDYHLTFGPDPATHTHCTLGGMIGNNSCGIHAQMSGRTSDNVHELEILTYDGVRMRVGPTSELELQRLIKQGGRVGEIYSRLKRLRDLYADQIRNRYVKIPRRVSGYNLDELLPENGFNVARALVGSESTLVTVLEATLKLVPSPRFRTLLVLGYENVFAAADHLSEVLKWGPIGLEGMDEKLVGYIVSRQLHPGVRSLLPEGKGWLIAEFGGETKQEADEKAKRAQSAIQRGRKAPAARVYSSKEEQENVWAIRESGLAATARVGNATTTWPGWEDSAVPPERVGDYLRDLRRLFDKHGYDGSLYGHFGQGCIHVRINFDLLTAEGIQKYRSFVGEAADLVVSYGGSLSGEHGDGQARAEFLEKMFGSELINAFREFKSIWDPDGKMNPGKIVDPFRVDENLRLGVDYAPKDPETHFKFPEDKGSLPFATLRCVGVGKCRRVENGTMCPSFMVTREEKHSTRGRAHLLFEMLQGDIIKDGWQSEAVKEALDLCLACKGCRTECPMNVDMATYKAEFLSHYYEKKARPRSAYAFGLIDVWARLASNAPELANLATQTPGLSRIAKEIAGVAPERKIPPFSSRTFKDAFFARRMSSKGARGKVLLWADTFNNYFHPEVSMAAVEVLETCGYEVLVAKQHLCCGRPLYDYGMLDLAKAYYRRLIEALQPYLRAGIPVVGLEPSCVSIFKDEFRGLFPNDQDGMRLCEQSFMLSDFLQSHAKEVYLPKLSKRAVVHGHCHHKTVLGMNAEREVLDRLGLDYQILDSGCCGMAGSFGFEKEADRYEVSMKVGERVLLPAVRHADKNALIVTNGFSCRTQICQGTQRQPLHLAEVIQLALKKGG